jgi:hypothetical protein
MSMEADKSGAGEAPVAVPVFTDTDPGMGLGPQQWPEGSLQYKAYVLMEDPLFNKLTIFATMWALFAPDAQLIYAPKVLDYPCAVVMFACFCLFCFELVANLWVKRDYGGLPGWDKITMFLVIDFVGTVSIIPEWVVLFPGVEVVQTSANLTLARAGRSARIGARLGRLVRLFRFQQPTPEYGLDGKKLEPQPSEIGHIVADKISARVVVVVMCLVVLMPMFLYAPMPQHQRMGIQLFAITHPNPTQAEAKEFLNWYNDCDYSRCTRDEELVQIKNPKIDYDRRNEPALKIEYEPYRTQTYQPLADIPCGETKSASGCVYSAVYQTMPRDVKQSTHSIIFLLSVVLMFGGGAAAFLNDIQNHVITPIENLKALCDNLSQTLSFLTMDGDEEDPGEPQEQDEVEYLENSIRKMEGLLRVGYGEAGSSIIARNLIGSSEKISPLLPGLKIEGVCVFIVLVDFGLVTECLEENIILYANYVNQVIHDCVVRHGGSPNKNMGGAVLCMFRASGAEAADSALKAVEEAIDSVNTHPELNKLIEGCAELNRRRPGFKVKLKAGIHTGWVIEGAVGSTHKIDASYLSPHVNMTARIETATFQYQR